jgi:hypothetical protein
LKIDSTQAGDQVTCVCGAVQEVPSLRDIRLLDREQAAESQVQRRGWDPACGVCFAGGITLALAGLLVFGWTVYQRTQLEIPEIPPDPVEEVEAAIDEMTAVEVWDVWASVRQEGLGSYFPPPTYIEKQIIRQMNQFLLGAVIAMAIGGALAAGAHFTANRRVR